jgi:hypothetical protein
MMDRMSVPRASRVGNRQRHMNVQLGAKCVACARVHTWRSLELDRGALFAARPAGVVQLVPPPQEVRRLNQQQLRHEHERSLRAAAEPVRPCKLIITRVVAAGPAARVRLHTSARSVRTSSASIGATHARSDAASTL